MNSTFGPTRNAAHSRRGALAWIALLSLVAVGPLDAQESPSEASSDSEVGLDLEGPDSVGNTIRNDAAVDRPAFFDRYFEWKGSFVERTGIAYGLDYSTVFLSADSSPGEDEASSGMMRFYGSWDLVGRGTKDTGSFIWKIEHRHRYGDVPPQGFASEVGFAGLFVPPFSNQEARTTNLYWRQRVNDGRTTILAGFLDATDYVDVYTLASPWTGFFNFAFSTGSGAIPVPNDAALGVAAGTMVTDQVYAIASLSDLNADPTDLSETLDAFFSENEYFTSLELGWTPAQEKIYFDNMHVTLWHVDSIDDAGVSSGWGINFSFVENFAEQWSSFLRAGFTDDGGSLYESSVSAGVSYTSDAAGSLVGFGLNWSDPNADTYGAGLDDQLTAELFYRWQASKALAITPDIQFLKDPALNADEDEVWIFGIRARLAF